MRMARNYVSAPLDNPVYAQLAMHQAAGAARDFAHIIYFRSAGISDAQYFLHGREKRFLIIYRRWQFRSELNALFISSSPRSAKFLPGG